MLPLAVPFPWGRGWGWAFFAFVGVTAKIQKAQAMLTPLLSVSPTARA